MNSTITTELNNLANVSFIAFDDRFFNIIGPSPQCDKIFNVSMAVHEAPCWIPSMNKLMVAPQNQSTQLLIDLNANPPTLMNFTSTPPLGSPNGAFLYQGKIIAGTNGFRNDTPPGLYSLDLQRNTSTPILNNYRGLKFATPDDLVVDAQGQVWFTDAPFGYVNNIYSNPPELPSAVYCWNMTSGAISVVVDTLPWPNGIAFSPDNQTVYITNTPLNATGAIEPLLPRAVYAYDLQPPHTLMNQRTFYVPDSHVADGIKVSENGYVFTAAGSTVDVVSPDGDLLGKISTGTETMNNLAFVPNGELWMTGQGGIWRARIAENGILNYG